MTGPSEEYFTEKRRHKAERKRKRRVGFDRQKHCSQVGLSTRFKQGDNLGAKSPSWKGGYYARYGLTYEDYDKLLAEQEGVCAVCHRPPKTQRLNVDHDHKTGRVRGLLCFRCNYGLGWFQDDIARFERIVLYLRRA